MARGTDVHDGESLTGAASTVVGDVLTGPPRAGRVVAVFPGCVYVDLGGRLLALECSDALGLPCAVVLPIRVAATPLASGPFSAVSVGDPAAARDRELTVGSLRITVGRWWTPVRPRGWTGGDVSARRAGPDCAGHRTEDRTGDRFVLGLLGLGPGLTPAGDDLLAGLLIGLTGNQAGRHHSVDLRSRLAGAVLRHAARTTWLSAQLLRLAVDGYGVPPAIALADALAGHGDNEALARALPALLAVGHSSGPALARGLLLAAGLQLAENRREAA